MTRFDISIDKYIDDQASRNRIIGKRLNKEYQNSQNNFSNKFLFESNKHTKVQDAIIKK